MAAAGDAQREMSPHTQCEKTDSRDKKKPHRWNLGIMADTETDEVPGMFVDEPRKAPLLLMQMRC